MCAPKIVIYFEMKFEYLILKYSKLGLIFLKNLLIRNLRTSK